MGEKQMFEKLNSELMELKEKLRTYEYLQGKLGKLQETLESERYRLKELKISLEKESLDVERLEGFSVSKVFYTILGSKEKQVEKERQEYLAAKLKYEECSNSVDSLERESCKLINELSNYQNIGIQYEQLLKTKQAMILSSSSVEAGNLTDLTESVADLKLDIKELDEAIKAGNAVLSVLNTALDYLSNAEDWGTWDMIGGGYFATAEKHSNIDDANDCVIQAQELLRRFKLELGDVDIRCDVDVSIDSFDTFADFFFDGLISDWVVQSQIEDSINNVSEVRDNVAQVVRNLKNNKDICLQEIESTDEKIKSLIESAL